MPTFSPPDATKKETIERGWPRGKTLTHRRRGTKRKKKKKQKQKPRRVSKPDQIREFPPVFHPHFPPRKDRRKAAT